MKISVLPTLLVQVKKYALYSLVGAVGKVRVQHTSTKLSLKPQIPKVLFDLT